MNMLELVRFTPSKCYFEATDQITFKVEITILIATLLLAAVLTRLLFLYVANIRETMGRSFSLCMLLKQFQMKVYVILSLWVLCMVFKAAINIWAYAKYMYRESQDVQQPPQGLLMPSALFYFTDGASTFWLMTLLMIIPNYWLQKSIDMIPQEKDICLDISDRKCIHKMERVSKIVLYYIYARFLILLEGVVIFFLIIFVDSTQAFQRHRSYIIMGDSFLLICYYLFGFYCSEYLRKKKLVQMKRQQYKTIKIEYFALLLVLILRIMFHGFFYISESWYHYEPANNCADRDPTNIKIRSLFIGVATLFMHFMPVAIILYIYRVRPRKQDDAELKLNQTDFNDA